MTDIDLTTLTDDDLAALRVQVLTEIERRQRIADTPTQMAAQARRFIEDGGDASVLTAAITEATGA